MGARAGDGEARGHEESEGQEDVVGGGQRFDGGFGWADRVGINISEFEISTLDAVSEFEMVAVEFPIGGRVFR